MLFYKFQPERTGFNMYAEYTRQQLTFLAIQPCMARRLLGLPAFHVIRYIVKDYVKVVTPTTGIESTY